MRNWTVGVVLSFSAAAGAQTLPIPNALEVQARVARQDVAALQAYFLRMGNPQATRHLIDQHVQGSNGAARDEAAMVRGCAIAARRGQAYGAFCLGDAYANGYAGYPRDMEKSLAWTRLAAERGMPTAQHDLGVMQL